jgi:glycosyltransferase involved in cell wall biosynthesis
MNVLTLHYETSKLVCINNPFIFPPSTIPVKKEKVVIWCGQVEYGMKRTDRMLSIWKHLWRRFPDWQLIILGAGQISHFEDLARQHDIQNVRFMGFGNPLEWYRRGSILCVTSCTEGWGLTLVEAMSQRCATIAYGSYSAVYDIIEDGVTGYVVPNNRESIYVKRLATLMEDEDLRLKMGEAGEQRISRFDLSAIADKYIRLFTEVQNNH